jgi:adenylate cyclase
METATKILIVDDNEQNLTLIRTILRRHGYDSLLARSGEEALREVRTEPPDLIILDVMMPGMDGIEVCRRLKDDEETRLIPIVIMTALDQPEDKIRGIEAGADDFLTKPVNQLELMARVRTALKLKQTIDRKLGTLLHIKEHLSKFVPLAVRRLVEAHPEAPELERRERDVSILFVDVSGYTRLSLLMDQDKLETLVERYFSHFLDCVHEHGGDIAETSGDRMMVVFQDDNPFDHARHAAMAALQMLEVTERLNQEWPETGTPIAVHIGVNSGPAQVGSSRFEGIRGTRWTFTANGSVVNLAARLGDAAAPGTILLGPETAKRIGGRLPLEAIGPQTFKNLDAMEVYRLCRKRTGTFS